MNGLGGRGNLRVGNKGIGNKWTCYSLPARSDQAGVQKDKILCFAKIEGANNGYDVFVSGHRQGLPCRWLNKKRRTWYPVQQFVIVK
jgi:hypothetical protein